MMDLRFDNDLVITNGDIATVDTAVAAMQRVRDRLLTFKGEWFLDLDFGPNYRADILIKNPRLDIISAILRAEILKSVDGSFISFTAALDSQRKLTIVYALTTTVGPVSGTVTL